LGASRALDETNYRNKLEASGFEQVDIEPTRIYKAEDAREFMATEGIDADTITPEVDGKIMSNFVRAAKPGKPAANTAYSAGSKPAGAIRPEAVKQIESAGLATHTLRSKSWEEFAKPGAPKMDFVFTVCDNAANETCPLWPGQPLTAHWGVPRLRHSPRNLRKNYPRLPRTFYDSRSQNQSAAEPAARKPRYAGHQTRS
jgi:protein-tyrosine-phosphatase